MVSKKAEGRNFRNELAIRYRALARGDGYLLFELGMLYHDNSADAYTGSREQDDPGQLKFEKRCSLW